MLIPGCAFVLFFFVVRMVELMAVGMRSTLSAHRY